MGPEQGGNHQRSALSAGQPAAKSCMANHVLFKKEDDFHTTFLVGHQLADPKVAGQMAYKFSMKQNTPNDSLEVHHLYYLQIMSKNGVLHIKLKNQKIGQC